MLPLPEHVNDIKFATYVDIPCITDLQWHVIVLYVIENLVLINLVPITSKHKLESIIL